MRTISQLGSYKGLDARWAAWETITGVCRSLAASVRADPWGPVAQQVLEAVEMSRPYGTTELLTAVIERTRQEAADAEREQVAGEIRDLVARSGLSKRDFALRIGTSRPRLSTYVSGKVTPSAALMLRMRRVTALAQARHDPQLPTCS